MIKKWKKRLLMTWIIIFIAFHIIIDLLASSSDPARKGKGNKRKVSLPSGTNNCKIALVSTFPPKRCGIATFTFNLISNLPKAARICELHLFALIDDENDDEMQRKDYLESLEMALKGNNYQIKKQVHFIIQDTAYPSKRFHAAAKMIKAGKYGFLLIQQEFGITKIMWQLLDLMRWTFSEKSEMLVSVVVHSPRAYPNLEERAIIRQMSVYCNNKLIVMSWHAYHSMIDAYGIPASKVMFIPHGVSLPPSFLIPDVDNLYSNKFFDLSHGNTLVKEISWDFIRENRVIFSNGLIHANKGYERIIRAMRYLVPKIPNLYYVIVGKEHGNNRQRGLMQDLYDRELEGIAGLKDKVIWIDEFMEPNQLQKFLALSDLYAAPFDEITPTSGTLLEAMANSIPTIATPFRFALEMLSDNRGLIMPFNDTSGQITASIINNFFQQEESKKLSMAKQAKMFISPWQWSYVSQFYWMHCLKKHDYPSKGPINFPSPDVFIDSFAEAQKSLAIVTRNFTTISFSGRETIFTPATISNSPEGETEEATITVALYVDFDVQINAEFKLNDDDDNEANYLLDSLYILSESRVFKIDSDDKLKYRKTDNENENDTKQMLITKDSSGGAGTFRIESFNLICTTAPGLSKLTFTMKSRFAHPLGLIGSGWREFQDLSMTYERKERQDDKEFFKTWKTLQASQPDSIGQQWSVFGIKANLFDPSHRYLLKHDSFSV